MKLKEIRERRPPLSREQAENALDDTLAEHGLDLYDSRGEIHSLDIRSVFADKHFGPTDQDPFLDRLPLELFEPGSNGTSEGEIHRFLSQLEHGAFCDTSTLYAYFPNARETGMPDLSIVTALKGYPPVFHLLALVFAWLEEYGCQYRDEHQLGYDAETNKRTTGTDLPPRPQQLSATVRFLRTVAGVPTSRQMLVNGFREMLANAGSTGFSDLHYLRRRTNHGCRAAFDHLVESLIALGIIDVQRTDQKEIYRFTDVSLESRFLFRLDQPSLANRLGFNDANKQMQRILDSTPGMRGTLLADFLARLQDTPLPGTLRALGRDYMKHFCHQGGVWNVPEPQWPACLGSYARDGHRASFAEERSEIKFFIERARETIESMIPRAYSCCFEGGRAYCRHDPYYFVGGDFYSLDGSQTFSILLGDAQGHGHPSAYIAAEIMGFLRGQPDLASEPSRLLDELNGLLRCDASAGQRASVVRRADVWAGQIRYAHDQSRVLRYACAAQRDTWLLRDGIAQSLSQPGFTLGEAPGDHHYRQFEVSLLRGDVLLIATDGIVDGLADELEADTDPSLFLSQVATEERQRAPSAQPKEFVEAIWNRIEELRPRRYWHDDATMIGVILE
jgi:serine phosphatase RsbU (regulator of sigma subunit)